MIYSRLSETVPSAYEVLLEHWRNKCLHGIQEYEIRIKNWFTTLESHATDSESIQA